MGPERWRGPLVADPLTVELEKAARHRAVHADSELTTNEGAPFNEVRQRGDLLGPKHGRHHDPPSLGLLRQLVGRAILEQIDVHRTQNVGLDRQAVVRRVPMVVAQDLGFAEPGPHRSPLTRAQDDEPDVAVPGRVHRVHRSRAVSELVVEAVCAGGCGGYDPVGELRHGLHHRHVEHLSGASGAPLPQGRQGAERGGDRRGVVGQRAGREEGRSVQRAGSGQHPTQGHQHLVGAHEVPIGAGETEVRNGGDDEPTMARRHLFGSEAEMIQRPGTGARDPYVGGAENRLEPRLIRRIAEVELHRRLVGVAMRPPQARSVRAERRQSPRRRTAWGLDLDHVGTEIAQKASTELTTLDGRVDHPQSGEGGHSGSSKVRSATVALASSWLSRWISRSSRRWPSTSYFFVTHPREVMVSPRQFGP